jgi:peptide/nickel transport system substrate-binding protein
LALVLTVSVAAWVPGTGAWAFNESPMLSKLVQEGKLPALEKRLPPSPVVLTPLERPGQFGGVWRMAYTGISDLGGATRILYEPLVRWSPDYRIVPNLAEKWDISEDGRTFTFYLVKGVRWSDGEPFTADDIIFYFEDILANKELTATIPKWLSPSGDPPKAEKVDDFTVRIEFERPYSLFLEQLACPHGMELVTKPKHFLRKYHNKYGDPAELEALRKEKKASTWAHVFQDLTDLRRCLFVDRSYPSLCAWIATVPAPAQRFVMERNPYYWKVDNEGNQLPYIDAISTELQNQSSNILLKAIAGEIDFQGRHLGGMQNSVLLLAYLSTGKYKLVPKKSSASVGILLAPNLNHKDPALRRILSDSRFRIAISHAINRNELNKIIYMGKGEPRQAAPLKESQFYSASYEKAYLEYNPQKAEALLDEMGLKKGSDGKRLRPDGKPLQISLDVQIAPQTWVDIAEIVASKMKSVGIDTEVKNETKELLRQRIQSSAHDIALWPGDGGLECLLEPRWYFPYSSESFNAPLYAQWFQSNGAKGEEPPPEIKEMMQTYQQIIRTVSDEKKKELFASIIAANEKHLWVIGTIYPPPDYYVAAPNMFNVPKKDFESWPYPNPGPIHPEQFFFGAKK